MAEQRDKEVCSICLTDYKTPVLIDCQHRFCFICLEDYVNKTTNKGQFLCPLCRCPIEGGMERFKPKLNIDDNSTIQQCGICTEDTCQYFCRDCDQYLCKSCKTTHDKMKICRDHVVCRYDEKQVCQQPNEPMKEKTPATSVTHPKDFCPNHEDETVKIYCKDCSLAVCFNCLVADHNGHNLLDLQKGETRQNIRQELKTLNEDLEKQITNFQKHYDNLNSKLTQFKNCTKTECDKVDAQVDKICSEFRKIGENIKKEMQKSSKQEESKFGKLMEDIKRLTEDLKASVKYSVNVLEDSSIVEVLQRLPKVRQEKDESCSRKLDIPAVRYSTFQVAEIDKTLLSNQLGKIVSCDENMYEDVFNVDTVSGYVGWYYGKQHVVSGYTWCTRVVKVLSSSLRVRLFLDDVEDKSITSCKVDVIYKVINKTDDRQSVVKQCNDTVKPGGWSDCYTDLIDWKRLSNPVSGFIDHHRNFTIQTTINKITNIVRRK